MPRVQGVSPGRKTPWPLDLSAPRYDTVVNKVAEEGFFEVFGARLDLVQRAESVGESVLWFPHIGQILLRLHVQTLQNWRQLLGDKNLLAFDDDATRPIDQFQVIGRGIRNGVFGVVLAVFAEAQQLNDGGVR